MYFRPVVLKISTGPFGLQVSHNPWWIHLSKEVLWKSSEVLSMSYVVKVLNRSLGKMVPCRILWLNPLRSRLLVPFIIQILVQHIEKFETFSRLHQSFSLPLPFLFSYWMKIERWCKKYNVFKVYFIKLKLNFKVSNKISTNIIRTLSFRKCTTLSIKVSILARREITKFYL